MEKKTIKVEYTQEVFCEREIEVSERTYALLEKYNKKDVSCDHRNQEESSLYRSITRDQSPEEAVESHIIHITSVKEIK